MSKKTSQLKIAIVSSSFYPDLTQSLKKACRQRLKDAGVKNIDAFTVPGSWEIPLIVKKLASSKRFDGIAALGLIIKGETYHFELIASECARALMNISLEYNIPVTFEVLATLNFEQARERSIGKYNKGVEAAQSLLKTISELSKL